MSAPKPKVPGPRRTQEERRRETRRRLIDATIAVIAERVAETSSQATQVSTAVEAVTQQSQTLREIIESS